MKELKLNVIKGSIAALLAATLGMSHGALANTQLNITGTIKASPCIVADDNGSGITVDLGNGSAIQAATLAGQGDKTEWVPFKLTLKDCPTTTTSATATFSGTPADESADLYKNTGDAKSVQIELADVAETTKLGNGKSLKQTIANNTTTYDLKARAYTTEGGATPGSIVGTVMVAFTYE
ncbi:fimbrial protein [Serratia rubidaea]|uniref:fimbrial protein n=1 Tax=Serratia rubidaea TaxID=61652 RepID=UPI0022B926DA|nr:fimbrial protein [Serratia rubidaea]WBF46381.1 type 1 fimbrial protein [Serratia rubidaea]